VENATASKKIANSRARYITLKQATPSAFHDMYTSDILENATLTASGRPSFTQRNLVDWGLNDVRSLLIITELKPEWNGVIPTIVEPGYKFSVLPLTSSNRQIVETLVSSDIYKEFEFDKKFLTQTAKYTVEAARHRRTSSSSVPQMFEFDQESPLTKAEWRNIIENYLLNLGCEAQCRLDYERICHTIKRQKRLQSSTTSSQSSSLTSSSISHHSPSSSPPSLLKQALLASSSTSPDFPSYLKPKSASTTRQKISLSREEKQRIWVQVQSQLYRRLGLDWEADELV